MRKKWVLLSFVLGLGVVLDVTPAQSQFEQGGKGKGGKKGERTFTFGQGAQPGGFGQPGIVVQQAPGGFGGQPGAFGQPGAYGQPGGDRGFGGKGGERGFGQPGGTGFGQPSGYGSQPGAFGQPGGFGGDRGFGGKGGDRGPGGFGQTGGDRGGPPGGDRGGPGGGRGAPDPEQSWKMLVGVSKGTDTIKFDNIPPDSRVFLRRMSEKAGTPPLPETGEWTKDQFLAHATASAQLMQTNQGGGSWNGQGNGWGQGGGENGFDPRAMNRREREKKEEEEERPVAIRYGKLPKDAPAMFTEMDSDKDGQIGLYEWRTAGNSLLAFQEMDLNGDGLLTVEEYSRYNQLKSDREKAIAYEDGERPRQAATSGRGAGNGPGGFNGRPGGPSATMPYGPGGTPTEKSKDGGKDEKRGNKDGGGKDGANPGRGMWGGMPSKK